MRRLILFPLVLFRFAGFFGFAGLFALMLGALPLAAWAQAGEFEVAQNGHTVGTANFQFTATIRPRL